MYFYNSLTVLCRQVLTSRMFERGSIRCCAFNPTAEFIGKALISAFKVQKPQNLLIKYDLDRRAMDPKFKPDWGSNSLPSDHDSTFHVTETPALTIWPSVT